MNALESKVLELIGEDVDAPDVFVDTDDGLEPIRDSLNDAIQEIVMLTGAKKSKYYLPLRAEQMFYRFALNTGDLGWITDAWAQNRAGRLTQTDLIRLCADDRRWMIPSGNPWAYFQVGQDVIGFYPKPSADSDVIELTVVEIPRPYETSSERINLRRDFQYAAVNYAVAEYWASRGDAREADSYFGLYLDTLGLRDKFTYHVDRQPQLQTVKEAQQ